jgi:hypothetical protein
MALLLVLTSHNAVAETQHDAGSALPEQRDITPPVIECWYGDHQVFGRLGNPQRWINILGRVSDQESEIVSLRYKLNGRSGPEIDGQRGKLNFGPYPDLETACRLFFPGDFNIELDKDMLKPGANNVVVIAMNAAGLESRRKIVIEYHKGRTWPLPYFIDWKDVVDAQEVLQIVDGLWSWDERGIRPQAVGYDRLLTVGDMTWRDYEAALTITVHELDKSRLGKMPSWGCNVTVFPRWQGHTDNPIQYSQPKHGWMPTGPMHGFFWLPDQGFLRGIRYGPEIGKSVVDSTMSLELGQTYWFKLQVRTVPTGTLCQFKVWRDGEAEPGPWMFKRLVTRGYPPTGSLGLLAHHVDVTFGNLEIVPIREAGVRGEGQGEVSFGVPATGDDEAIEGAASYPSNASVSLVTSRK